MNLLSRLKRAKQIGERVVRDEGITALPVDPIAIARKHDIVVRAKPDTAEGVSGMLLRYGDNFGIMYATHIVNQGFQNFSVAHELGHYFLDGHLDHLLPEDGVHSSHAGFTSADPYEMEADHFAAGLMMPSGLFKRALNRHDPGLAAIEVVANLCRTSLTATAIRCAELSADALAIVISTGPTVDFCFFSEAIKSLPGIGWIRKGTPVPVGSATAALNADFKRVLDGGRAAEEVNSVDWLGGSRSVQLTEEVVGLGRYGKTLTVLSSRSLALADEGYDDDEREEEELIESYTPRFRR